MDNILLIIFMIITIVMTGILVWLIQAQNKLKRDYTVLNEYLDRNNKDIAGLCSAAVYVDTQVSNNKKKLEGIAEKVIDFEQQQDTSHPYHAAIQKVRHGANAVELVQQCGLSQEEAVLLIRLHGNSSHDPE